MPVTISCQGCSRKASSRRSISRGRKSSLPRMQARIHRSGSRKHITPPPLPADGPRTAAISMLDPRNREEIVGRGDQLVSKNSSPFARSTGTRQVRRTDKDVDRILRTIESGEGDIEICFLGRAGIGKSTLINALVAEKESVLSAGGIGPLTAHAYVQIRRRPPIQCRVPWG